MLPLVNSPEINLADYTKTPLVMECVKNLPSDISRMILHNLEILHLPVEKNDLSLSMRRIMHFSATTAQQLDYIVKYFNKAKPSLYQMKLRQEKQHWPENSFRLIYEYILDNAHSSSLAESFSNIPFMKDLANRRNFVLAAMQDCNDDISDAFQFVSKDLRNDPEIALAAVQKEYSILRYVSKDLRNNQQFMLAAVKLSTHAFIYASDTLQNDPEIILAAIHENSCNFCVGHFAARNRELLLAAVKKNGHVLGHACRGLEHDREIALAAVKQKGSALGHASDVFQNDPEIVLAAIQQDGLALTYASDAFKKDRTIVLAAIQQNRQAFQFASDTLKNDEDFILAAKQHKS